MRPLRLAVFSVTASSLMVSAALGAALTGPADAAPPSKGGSDSTTTTTTTKGKGGKPTATTTATPTPTAAPQVCHTLADAAALTTVRGRTVNTLFPHDGRVFYGYGDYTANTGSMIDPYGTNVSSFDAATGVAAVHLPGFKTEEVNTFRSFDGDIYAPNIDPSRGADGSNSFASDAGQTWTENAGAPNPVHVFDVAKAGGELFVAGAEPIASPAGTTHGAATIWRSTDAGATWTVAQSETEEDVTKRDGFERYYWMGVIGDKVYARAALNTYPAVPPLRVLDTTTDTWSTVPESGMTFGTSIYEASRVVSWQNRLWTAQGALVWFDGAKTGAIGVAGGGANLRTLSIGDDGKLYGHDWVNGAVYRVDSTSTAYALTRVATIAPDAASFTVAGGNVWAAAAAGTAQVCSTPLA
ncbi:hypothetical protein [Nocardioides piscis]|uniref:Exo-alpha-sialidase n=1 Tax=Nocardioides piscis TaxID=2714938 RepID=A0A6G7YGA6_9ACTN|nr:hypothetical protein [Nocardioides piscis]QIK75810.1 hypothetical protein G7071_10510 [Nocardioides piscis]